jgi:hypothetical protein
MKRTSRRRWRTLPSEHILRLGYWQPSVRRKGNLPISETELAKSIECRILMSPMEAELHMTTNRSSTHVNIAGILYLHEPPRRPRAIFRTDREAYLIKIRKRGNEFTHFSFLGLPVSSMEACSRSVCRGYCCAGLKQRGIPAHVLQSESAKRLYNELADTHVFGGSRHASVRPAWGRGFGRWMRRPSAARSRRVGLPYRAVGRSVIPAVAPVRNSRRRGDGHLAGSVDRWSGTAGGTTSFTGRRHRTTGRHTPWRSCRP